MEKITSTISFEGVKILTKGTAGVYTFETFQDMCKHLQTLASYPMDDHTILRDTVMNHNKKTWVVGIWQEVHGIFIATVYLSGEVFFTQPIHDKKFGN